MMYVFYIVPILPLTYVLCYITFVLSCSYISCLILIFPCFYITFGLYCLIFLLCSHIIYDLCSLILILIYSYLR